MHIFNCDDFIKLIGILFSGGKTIEPNTFKNQDTLIEMPSEKIEEVLCEKFIVTDILRVKANKLRHVARKGWLEVTVGVVSQNDTLYVFNPSITIAEGEVLSVEEKFQGGTGVNITPPPKEILSALNLNKVKHSVKELAEKLNITGYSRIDAFVNIHNSQLFIIEVNTLPGLTPSTVLYHQALAENPPLYPKDLLELLIKNKGC